MNPQTLGEHLRLARIDRGLKQTELARLLGVVYQTVVTWEHNLVPMMSPKSRARVVAFSATTRQWWLQIQQRTQLAVDVGYL